MISLRWRAREGVTGDVVALDNPHNDEVQRMDIARRFPAIPANGTLARSTGTKTLELTASVGCVVPKSLGATHLFAEDVLKEMTDRQCSVQFVRGHDAHTHVLFR